MTVSKIDKIHENFCPMNKTVGMVTQIWHLLSSALQSTQYNDYILCTSIFAMHRSCLLKALVLQ